MIVAASLPENMPGPNHGLVTLKNIIAVYKT